MRIAAFLDQQEIAYESIPHAPAFTAEKRAKYLHVPGSQVAKSVLLRGPGGRFLIALLPATHHIDYHVLQEALGGPVRLADNREIALLFPDCEWGVVPPFGGLYGLPTVLDDLLRPDSLLLLEGHTHVEALRIRCRDLERLEKPRRLAFARRKAMLPQSYRTSAEVSYHL